MKRYCDLHDLAEVSDLKVGMDFRLPQYRREVFLRFYEFHLRHRAHAGGVYYVMPALFDELKMDDEQRLWFCFINGCSQHVLSTYEIFTRFPDFAKLDEAALSEWFRANYRQLGWDTDRRYHKNTFEKHVSTYRELVLPHGSQRAYFEHVMAGADNPAARFDRLWPAVLTGFYGFGRLASFSYIEYLRIAGLDIDCSNLFLNDINGSKSHRNGLCKVLGRDDRDWHPQSNPDFDGRYTREDIAVLQVEAEKLLEDARARIAYEDVSYFTLETTLCCYKSWHRPNRRYPNVYNDMLYDRIAKHSENWSPETVELFLRIRAAVLPDYLLLERNPRDVGVAPIKQNWYRETGQVIMMHREWPCFANGYNAFVESEDE